MTPRSSLVCALLLACGCAGESISDQPGSDVDLGKIGWEEPGAEPDLPLDAGGQPRDAGELDAGLAGDASLDAAIPADAGGDAGATAADASTDAALSQPDAASGT